MILNFIQVPDSGSWISFRFLIQAWISSVIQDPESHSGSGMNRIQIFFQEREFHSGTCFCFSRNLNFIQERVSRNRIPPRKLFPSSSWISFRILIFLRTRVSIRDLKIRILSFIRLRFDVISWFRPWLYSGFRILDFVQVPEFYSWSWFLFRNLNFILELEFQDPKCYQFTTRRHKLMQAWISFRIQDPESHSGSWILWRILNFSSETWISYRNLNSRIQNFKRLRSDVISWIKIISPPNPACVADESGRRVQDPAMAHIVICASFLYRIGAHTFSDAASCCPCTTCEHDKTSSSSRDQARDL